MLACIVVHAISLLAALGCIRFAVYMLDRFAGRAVRLFTLSGMHAVCSPAVQGI
jgi:hypothetical protein